MHLRGIYIPKCQAVGIKRRGFYFTCAVSILLWLRSLARPVSARNAMSSMFLPWVNVLAFFPFSLLTLLCHNKSFFSFDILYTIAIAVGKRCDGHQSRWPLLAPFTRFYGCSAATSNSNNSISSLKSTQCKMIRIILALATLMVTFACGDSEESFPQDDLRGTWVIVYPPEKPPVSLVFDYGKLFLITRKHGINNVHILMAEYTVEANRYTVTTNGQLQTLLRPDHTFRAIFGISLGETVSGKWTLSPDKLTLTLFPENRTPITLHRPTQN